MYAIKKNKKLSWIEKRKRFGKAHTSFRVWKPGDCELAALVLWDLTLVHLFLVVSATVGGPHFFYLTAIQHIP